MAYEFLPQPKSISFNDLLRGRLANLPPGGLRRDPDSNIYKLMYIFALSDKRVVDKAQELQDQLNPRTATADQALPEWEKIAVDEQCNNIAGLTEDERELLVVESLKGGLPYLTPAALKARLDGAFDPTFTVTETFTHRYKDDRAYNVGSYADNPFITVSFTKGSLTDATVELIRCFVNALIPVTTRHLVVVN